MTDFAITDVQTAQAGGLEGTSAAGRLIDAFGPRIHWHAYNAATVGGTTNYDVIEDLEQDARLKLWQALDRFEGTTEGQFASFAEGVIKGAVGMSRQAGDSLVSRDTANRFERALRAANGDVYLAQMLASDPDVMGKHGLSTELALAARMAYQGVFYLDAPLPNQADTTVGDMREPKIGPVLVSEIGIPEDLIEPADITAAQNARERRETVPKVHSVLSMLSATQRLILQALTGIEPVAYYGTENDDALAEDHGLVRKQIKVNRSKAKSNFAAKWIATYGEWS
ncbi:hypothetical protein LHJ74_30860 [Streptomyces sp. N2-109]|uniref:RNA polymerase sigma-70 region 2 domain-containing protein n=1 Tax=Streptomyces gossypii TaxID=2883101 RepID=A0ABT2K2Z1_9ACTN|nr:sigma factor [Streptomyces gossypii]MCT2594258.1 hypothetical protein [Streptomyces gossypii]